MHTVRTDPNDLSSPLTSIVGTIEVLLTSARSG